jgi:hypothetical protein
MQAQQSFDSEQKIELLAQAHAVVVEVADDYVALAVEDTGAGMPPEIAHGPSIRSSRRRRSARERVSVS